RLWPNGRSDGSSSTGSKGGAVASSMVGPPACCNQPTSTDSSVSINRRDTPGPVRGRYTSAVARIKADVRREGILRATCREGIARGFASTRGADVAAALGVSTGLVFYHFTNKETLLGEAFRYAAGEDLERLSGAAAGGGAGARGLGAGRGRAPVVSTCPCPRPPRPAPRRRGCCGSPPGARRCAAPSWPRCRASSTSA